jgi:hypothetical protein
VGKTMLECVLLAGAPADAETKARYNVEWRAEVPIAGERMVDRVIAALRDSGCVGKIACVGALETGADEDVAPGATFLENVMRGLEAAGDGDTVLVASSDIPLVTGAAISDFVELALRLDADFAYPIIPKDECLLKYPQLKRTFIRVREGTFTGGNAVLIKREFALRSRGRIQELYEARKKPLLLARMIGAGVLARAAIAQKIWAGAASIELVEEKAGSVMGGRLRAVRCGWPEIGEDADRLEDFEAMDRILRGVA